MAGIEMKTGPAGISLIKTFEGFRAKAYQDEAGVWTLGYGHTGANTPIRIKAGDTCTVEGAEALLLADLHEAEYAVNNEVKVPINQNQFDALVSFAYNVGWAALESSTLLILLNSGQPASDEFLKWDHIRGIRSAGLLRRREAEQALFLKPELVS